MQANCFFIDEKDHDGQAVKVPVFLNGEVINKRYQIIQTINFDSHKREVNSGQGLVYKGMDIKTNKLVAIKQALYPNNQKAIEKINREAFITINFGRLNSYIVRGIDYIEFPNSLKFLIMEYIDGITLEELTLSTDKQFTEFEIIELLYEISKPLVFLSSLGWVMRDLKPGNIMIDKTGQLKLIDFGCCHSLGNQRFKIGTKINSLIYSTRELREQGKYDYKTDLYSFGATACFLITKGNIPDTHLELLLLLNNIQPRISYSFYSIINSLITNNRIGSAKQLQDDLSKIKARNFNPFDVISISKG